MDGVVLRVVVDVVVGRVHQTVEVEGVVVGLVGLVGLSGLVGFFDESPGSQSNGVGLVTLPA